MVSLLPSSVPLRVVEWHPDQYGGGLSTRVDRRTQGCLCSDSHRCLLSIQRFGPPGHSRGWGQLYFKSSSGDPGAQLHLLEEPALYFIDERIRAEANGLPTAGSLVSRFYHHTVCKSFMAGRNFPGHQFCNSLYGSIQMILVHTISKSDMNTEK